MTSRLSALLYHLDNLKSWLKLLASAAAILACTSCTPGVSDNAAPPTAPIPVPNSPGPAQPPATTPQPQPEPMRPPAPPPEPQPEPMQPPAPPPEPQPEPMQPPAPPPEPQPEPMQPPAPPPEPQPEPMQPPAPPPEPQPEPMQPPAPPPEPQPTPPPPQASDFETDEYFGMGTSSPTRTLRYYGLETLKASSAYAAGATGENVRVAVVDTGIYTALSEFDGKDIPVVDMRADQSVAIEQTSHGTQVAAILAANRDQAGFHGIAYQASLIDIRANLEQFDLATVMDAAANMNADIVSLSAGAPVEIVSQDSLTPQELQQLQAALSAHINAVDRHNIILVTSAGNDGAPANGDTPAQGQWPNYPAFIAGQMLCGGSFIPITEIESCAPDMRGATSDNLVIAVGSVDPDGKISSFSNRAGPTQSHFLLAPGGISSDNTQGIPHASNPELAVTGTSFSAPLVSGALALLLDAFPMLTPQNAVLLLLNTADDYIDTEIDPIAGVAAGVGPDPVGGRGIVNLQRAFQPQGIMTLSLSGSTVPVSQTFASPDAVFGDWAHNAFDGLIAQDSYNRGFQIHSSGLAQQPLKGRFAGFTPVNVQSGSLQAGSSLQFGWQQTKEPTDPIQRLNYQPRSSISGAVKFGDGRISFGHNSTSNANLILDQFTPDTWIQIQQTTPLGSAFASSHSASGRQSMQLGLTHAKDDWLVRVSTQIGQDNTSALGGNVLARIGRNDAASFSVVTLDAQTGTGPLSLSASLTTGNAHIAGGLTSGVQVSAWSAAAAADVASGRLTLTVSQPLRSETGWLDVLIPVSVSQNGSLIRQNRRVSLTPSGREIDLEARWSRLLNDRHTQISVQAAMATSPYHVAGSPAIFAIRASLTRNW